MKYGVAHGSRDAVFLFDATRSAERGVDTSRDEMLAAPLADAFRGVIVVAGSVIIEAA